MTVTHNGKTYTVVTQQSARVVVERRRPDVPGSAAAWVLAERRVAEVVLAGIDVGVLAS